MAQRTCEVDGCERPHQARGFCGPHYSTWHRRTHGRKYEERPRTCIVCGKTWDTRRTTAKLCSDECRSKHYRELMQTKCVLPPDHPVILETQRRKTVAAEERAKAKAQRNALARRSKFEWRIARECRGCGSLFTPIYTPNMLDCSRRCARRVARWRRRAAEVNAPGSWVWSDFMRMASRFDYRCAYCGNKPGRLDPDHVVPLSRGGYNSVANLLPACNPCNADKRNLLLSEWVLDRERRGLPPRSVTWGVEDRRYAHLTQALLVEAA